MKSVVYSKQHLNQIEEMLSRFLKIAKSRDLKFARGEWGVSIAPSFAYPKLIENWISQFGSVDIGGATLLALQPANNVDKLEAFTVSTKVTKDFAQGLFHGWDMNDPSWNQMKRFEKQYAQGYKLGAKLAKKVFGK